MRDDVWMLRSKNVFLIREKNCIGQIDDENVIL